MASACVWVSIVLLAGPLACRAQHSDIRKPPGPSNPDTDSPEATRPDDDSPEVEEDCGFDYEIQFAQTSQYQHQSLQGWRPFQRTDESIDWIVHPEPEPLHTWRWSTTWSTGGITMPGYSDSMELFERAVAWTEATRCYETPTGPQRLTEAQAFALYQDIAEMTTGEPIDTSDGLRTVVGIRGAWPGTFDWHGNTPNQFNDTLVLLWQEEGIQHVREFPVNTDTGAVYFGYHSASSLRPNRRYAYTNAWHRSYNAPQMAEWGYRVADDSNGNGHWDRDRNGWLDGGAADHEREGGAHNIHMASVDGPLGQATIDNWSAGCQVIPGMANWTEFITNYWTGSGDDTDYFLVDARDISPRVWQPCEADGSHSCPFPVESTDYTAQGDTSKALDSVFDTYNCSDADESGPEDVYVLTVHEDTRLSVAVESDEGADIDVYLLDGDDSNACLARDHLQFDYDISPGRYFVVADTWVDNGASMAGRYTLHIDLAD